MSIEQTRAKNNRYPFCLRVMVGSLVLLLCASGVLGLQGCKELSGVGESKVEMLSHWEAQDVYEDLLKATSFGKSLLYNDNLIGRIVWNEAQFMESLINMYDLTK
ncbi:MAG: hypothetical protein ACPL4I_12670, partial [Bacteroidota bacterium]